MVTQFPGAPVKGGSEKAGASKRPYGFRSESSTSTLEVAMLLQGTKARQGDRCVNRGGRSREVSGWDSVT